MYSTIFTIIIFLTPLVLLASFIPGLSVAPFVPTMKKDVKRMVELAEILEGEVAYDLGCGDGRLLLEASKYKAQIVGVEVAPLMYAWTKLSLVFHRKKIRMILNDLFRVDLREADVIFFFLMPNVLPKLQEKILRECKKGCRVVSYSFPLEGWDADKVDQLLNRMPVYRYIVQ
ncbi:MAG: class I SAM-dependent methyltransferase [bacterium]